jgi:hypothetical protein
VLQGPARDENETRGTGCLTFKSAGSPLATLRGKLDVLRVECNRCERKGRYSVAKLIEKCGRRANMMKWKEQLNGDLPETRRPPV